MSRNAFALRGGHGLFSFNFDGAYPYAERVRPTDKTHCVDKPICDIHKQYAHIKASVGLQWRTQNVRGRGDSGADGGGAFVRGIPLPTGQGSGEGAPRGLRPLTRIFFVFFVVENTIF